MAALLMALVFAFPGAESWTHYTHLGAVYDVAAWDSTIACATSGGVAFASLTSQGISWDSTYTYPGRLSHSRASDLSRDDSGNLWVGLYGGGIDLFMPDGSVERFGLLEGLPANLEINQVVPDTLVYAATTQGLSIRELGFFQTYTNSSTGGGLPSNRVLCLLPTADGLMVGTDQGASLLLGGAYPGTASSWTEYSETQGTEIRDLAAGTDTIWAASSSGLLRLASGGSWQQHPAYPGGAAYSVEASGDTLVVGGANAVYCRTGAGWSSDSSFPGEVISALLIEDGQLLAGQYAIFSDQRAWGEGLAVGWPTLQWRKSHPSGIPANDLESVSATSQAVWTGTDDNGAGVLMDGAWTIIRSVLPSQTQIFSVLSAQEGGYVAPYYFGLCWVEMDESGTGQTVCWTADETDLINNQVVDMASPSPGMVWLAQVPFTESEQSGAVLLSWVPGLEGSEQWTQFQQLQGLPSGTVNSIDVPFGESGTAWAGTGAGAVKLSEAQGEAVEVLEVADGLPAAEVLRVACAPDGGVWFGTTGGLARLDPQGMVEQFGAVIGSVEALCLDNLGAAWASTSQALYRVDADGAVEEINTFNSPLLSLDITAMDCDTERGLLYIATSDHGLWEVELESGLQGDGSGPVLFPNPFLPEVDGVVRVAGLPDEATTFRVFDLSGSLVYESQPTSRSQLTWDGSTASGTAASGAYIVVVEQGAVSWLRKLALVR